MPPARCPPCPPRASSTFSCPEHCRNLTPATAFSAYPPHPYGLGAAPGATGDVPTLGSHLNSFQCSPRLQCGWDTGTPGHSTNNETPPHPSVNGDSGFPNSLLPTHGKRPEPKLLTPASLQPGSPPTLVNLCCARTCPTSSARPPLPAPAWLTPLSPGMATLPRTTDTSCPFCLAGCVTSALTSLTSNHPSKSDSNSTSSGKPPLAPELSSGPVTSSHSTGHLALSTCHLGNHTQLTRLHLDTRSQLLRGGV